MSQCQACSAANRDIARFCKRCGQAMPASGGALDPLGQLIGLAPIRQALADLAASVEGRRLASPEVRIEWTTLIIGGSGTAKTRLGHLIAEALAGLRLTTRATAVVVDGLQPAELELKSLAAQFDSAKGGVLFVDNAHMLVSDKGDPQPALNLLLKRVEQSPQDPVLIMAGLPNGLDEFLENEKARNLIGRIKNILHIGDYDAVQLTSIAERDLQGKGFTLDDAVRDRLAMRMRWLYRALQSGNTSIRSVNGRLALDVAAALEDAYYRRKVTDRVLLPDDVRGEIEQRKSIDEILVDLNGLVGMAGLKQEVALLYRDIETARLRTALGVGADDDSQHGYHFTLTGNPGTGKTTVARLLGNIFEALGVLPSGHLVEVERGKLVGQYQGQTAPLVHAACDRAIGGVLFIDEAYGLNLGDHDIVGQEAITTLLKRMEDDRGKYIVIAAGYRDQMSSFTSANPGLASRFQRSFHLEDYTPSELAAILAGMAAAKKFQLAEGTHLKVEAFFADRCARKSKDFANGREARNLLPVIRRAQGERLRKLPALPGAAALVELLPEDVPTPNAGSGQSIDEILADLDAMAGLGSVKETVRSLQASLERDRVLGNAAPLASHFLFTGNPGTGKTTVARLMARIFQSLGLLPTDRLIEVDRGKLVARYQGQTAPLVHAACDQAIGGILFIDEAYNLCNDRYDSFGREAVNTLLKRMEDDRGKFIVIAAGYDREMQTFLASNSGLPARFSNTIHFDDYDPAAMLQIFLGMMVPDRLNLADDAAPALEALLRQTYEQRGVGFANGRTVRQLFDRAKLANSVHVKAAGLQGEAQAQAFRTLTRADIQAVIAP